MWPCGGSIVLKNRGTSSDFGAEFVGTVLAELDAWSVACLNRPTVHPSIARQGGMAPPAKSMPVKPGACRDCSVMHMDVKQQISPGSWSSRAISVDRLALGDWDTDRGTG